MRLRTVFRNLRRSARDCLLQCRIQDAFPSATFDRRIAWTCDDLRALSIGPHVSIGPFCDIVVLAHSPHSHVSGFLSIGARSVVGAFANVRAAGGRVIIGSDCLIAQHVSLIAANHRIIPGETYWKIPWDDNVTGIVIGKNCWIGAGAVILPGCTIGDDSIVGAGAVVTKNIPPNEIWANIPARKIGEVRGRRIRSADAPLTIA